MLSPSLPARLPAGRGFTVTELLVSIACLATLILLVATVSAPVLRNAREVKCITHLRHLHRACMAYVADKNGYFPSYRPDHSSSHAINPGIADYLGLKGVQYLSADDYRETVFTCPEIQTTSYRSGRPYLMNLVINTRTTIGHGMSDPLLIKKPSLVENPARLMLFTEGAYNPTPGSTVTPPAYNYHTHVNWAMMERMAAPHRGKQNVIHLDGHVAAYTLAEIPTVRDTPFWSGK
ncbi:MAG TPA: type II secretion system protein [Chthoniobacteraceae bacterium]|nr:type II secretion system protein [Chthoniobacteraceae bacterium]